VDLYEEIVIGSGLTATGYVMGAIEKGKKILVISDLQSSSKSNINYYPHIKTPLYTDEHGGLGNYWHGVIPLDIYTESELATFESFLNKFYPRVNLSGKIESRHFVPYCPIRPKSIFNKYIKNSSIEVKFERVIKIDFDGSKWIIMTEKSILCAFKLTISAGAIGTARILYRSPIFKFSRFGFFSDHVIFFAGQVKSSNYDQQMLRSRSGIFPKIFSINKFNADIKFILRPAAFDFKLLGGNLKARNVFANSGIKLYTKLFENRSLGLINEAVYNKFGISLNTDISNIYMQVPIINSYSLDRESGSIKCIESTIKKSLEIHTKFLKENLQDFVAQSHQNSWFPGIHLFRSIDYFELETVKSFASSLKIVDSTVIQDIGYQHHTFKLMFDAYKTALMN
jgi:hypothetical protein